MTERTVDVTQDGDLFPRDEVLSAVAGADWRERGVRPWSIALVSLGLALVALGTPVAGLLSTSPTRFVVEAGAAVWLRPATAAAGLLAEAGLAPERAWFLVSACAYAACVPATVLALRAAGFGGLLSFAAAVVALVGPAATVVASTPTDAPFAILASAVLAAALFASDDGTPGAFRRRAALAAVVALWLHPASVVLLPAVVVAVHRRGGWRGGAVPAAALVVAGALAAWALVAPPGTAGLVGTKLTGDLALERTRAGVARLAWNVPASLALVAITAAPPLVAATWRRAREESGPPAWFWVAVAGPLLAWPLSALDLHAAPYALLPLAAVGVADLANRCVNPGTGLAWVGLLAAIAVGGSALGSTLRGPDRFPLTGLGELGIEDLLVVVEEPAREGELAGLAYLAPHRHGVETVAWSGPGDAPALRGAAASARRIVLAGVPAAAVRPYLPEGIPLFELAWTGPDAGAVREVPPA